MGRAPCCEKMGLKKGPWTPEEDRILITYINSFGHSNWRALPKHAGLLRCGKSCRLRWINYLRPDIKRGNFTTQEEQAIISLHQMLGNRWSAIAARLPGRTDNEIKNVWHTHLKKRLPQHQQSQDIKPKSKQQTKLDNNYSDAAAKQEQQQQLDTSDDTKHDHHDHMPLSPPQCSSSDISTLTTSSDNNNNNINHHHNNISNNNDKIDSPDGNDLALDEDFWSEVLSAHNSCETTTTSDNFPSATIIGGEIDNDEFQFSSMCDDGDGMDFWYDVYARAEELTEFLEL